jgi:hypothetical protein
MREAIGEDIEPRLRGMLHGHAEAMMTAGENGTAVKAPGRSRQ